jgi:predicted DNA-binding transcriptional regulator AlpA
VKLKDFLPLKAVVEDLGVSRWTLWRASRSGIVGFPKATKVGRQIYWKKSEMEALEAALMQFKGRCVFDNERRHARTVKALTRTKAARRKRMARLAQQDLFS